MSSYLFITLGELSKQNRKFRGLAFILKNQTEISLEVVMDVNIEVVHVIFESSSTSSTAGH